MSEERAGRVLNALYLCAYHVSRATSLGAERAVGLARPARSAQVGVSVFAPARRAFANGRGPFVTALASRVVISLTVLGMAGLSAAMEEPAIARTRRSLRSDLQLIALVLSIAAWDASVVLVIEIAGKPIAFDWLPRLGHLVLGGLLCVGPGVLGRPVAVAAGNLYSDLAPARIRTFAAFVLGSAIGHWLAFRWIYASPTHAMKHGDACGGRLEPAEPTVVLGAASIVGAMYWWRRGSVIRRELHRTGVGLLALQADRAEAELMRLRTQVEPHFLFNTVHWSCSWSGATRPPPIEPWPG